MVDKIKGPSRFCQHIFSKMVFLSNILKINHD